ncbi:MAG: hypothetical protein HY343_08475 [Lentisphaerae bacterium]|nr:hypothetical protein [Lentisphaerota bacterium]
MTEKTTAAAGGGVVKLEGPDSCATTDPVGVVPAPGLRWSVRVKGEGVLQTVFMEKDQELGRRRVVVHAPDWVWVDFPLPATPGLVFIAFRFSCLEGRVDADLALLEAGRPLPLLQQGESWTLPAACFFHAGHTDVRRGSVNFRKERDIASVVLYGPKLPLERGRYRATIDFASPAPAGETLGACNIQCEERDRCAPQALVAGAPAALEFEQPASLPVNLVVTFERAADLEIRAVTFTRMEGDPGGRL